MRHDEILECDDPSGMKADRQPQSTAAQARPCEHKAHGQHGNEFGENENSTGEMTEDSAEQRKACQPMRGIGHAPSHGRLDEVQNGKNQRGANTCGERAGVAQPKTQEQATEQPFLHQRHAHRRNQHLGKHPAYGDGFFADHKMPQ